VAYYIKCCVSCQPCNGEYIQIMQIEKVPEKCDCGFCVGFIPVLVHIVSMILYSLIGFYTCFILAVSYSNCLVLWKLWLFSQYID
jgi:hypothetical protein